jgi:hypothetical protein
MIRRKQGHKTCCNNNKDINVYNFINSYGGWSNWSMILVEQVSCKNSYEARAKEREYIVSLKATLNSIIPNRTPEEYRGDNKSEIAEYCKQYQEENKSELAAYQKQYRKDNKSKIAALNKQYQENNKSKIAAERKQYRENNKIQLAAYQKEYREKNKPVK